MVIGLDFSILNCVLFQYGTTYVHTMMQWSSLAFEQNPNLSERHITRYCLDGNLKLIREFFKSLFKNEIDLESEGLNVAFHL